MDPLLLATDGQRETNRRTERCRGQQEGRRRNLRREIQNPTHERRRLRHRLRRQCTSSTQQRIARRTQRGEGLTQPKLEEQDRHHAVCTSDRGEGTRRRRDWQGGKVSDVVVAQPDLLCAGKDEPLIACARRSIAAKAHPRRRAKRDCGNDLAAHHCIHHNFLVARPVH